MSAKLLALFGGLTGRALMIALLIAAILFGVSQCQNTRRESAKADLSADQADAVSNSAKDAIGAVGAVSGRDSVTDQITQENADAIRQASGASTPVNAAARDAALRGLCRRAAYRGKPECLRLSPTE